MNRVMYFIKDGTLHHADIWRPSWYKKSSNISVKNTANLSKVNSQLGSLSLRVNLLTGEVEAARKQLRERENVLASAKKEFDAAKRNYKETYGHEWPGIIG